jgi:hypothetical protein
MTLDPFTKGQKAQGNQESQNPKSAIKKIKHRKASSLLNQVIAAFV